MSKRVFHTARAGNVAIHIYQCRQIKHGKEYIYYSIPHYVGDERRHWTSSDPQKAKLKADEFVAAKARAEDDRIVISVREFHNIHEALAPYRMRLDQATRLLAEALKLVSPEEIVPACRFWKDNRPASGFKSAPLNKAVPAYLGAQSTKVGERRLRAITWYLGQFSAFCGNRNVHEIRPGDIEQFVDSRQWAKSTRNATLKTISQFYGWAINQGMCTTNPADSKAVRRSPIKAGDVQIFSPAEMRKLLHRADDDLKPALALWSFGGVRKQELSRLTWEDEIEPGLVSGIIHIPAAKAKTGSSRNVPVNDALRAWLTAYRRTQGPLLPEKYSRNRAVLDKLTVKIARQTGLTWKDNAPRHSYCTYSLVSGMSPRDVAAAMGNSLAVLDKHYNNRAASITKTVAHEYFSIMPPITENVIAMPVAEPMPAPMEALQPKAGTAANRSASSM
jgi:integrase